MSIRANGLHSRQHNNTKDATLGDQMKKTFIATLLAFMLAFMQTAPTVSIALAETTSAETATVQAPASSRVVPPVQAAVAKKKASPRMISTASVKSAAVPKKILVDTKHLDALQPNDTISLPVTVTDSNGDPIDDFTVARYGDNLEVKKENNNVAIKLINGDRDGSNGKETFQVCAELNEEKMCKDFDLYTKASPIASVTTDAENDTLVVFSGTDPVELIVDTKDGSQYSITRNMFFNINSLPKGVKVETRDGNPNSFFFSGELPEDVNEVKGKIMIQFAGSKVRKEVTVVLKKDVSLTYASGNANNNEVIANQTAWVLTSGSTATANVILSGVDWNNFSIRSLNPGVVSVNENPIKGQITVTAGSVQQTTEVVLQIRFGNTVKNYGVVINPKS